jgi:SOS response regulatory protein OraA/RecX
MTEYNLDIYQKVFTKILNLLSFKPRTEKEVKDRLRSYVDKERIPASEKDLLFDTILARLKEDKYLDDKKTAQLYAESFLNNPKSRSIKKFQMALKKKGFSAQDIDRAVGMLPSGIEEAGAMKEARKKLISLKNQPLFVKKAKISNFLYSKGYAGSTIKAVVDTLLSLQ